MQTFLPYPGFTESARVLDRLRLGKQRLEAWQILRTLDGRTAGWKNHPAVRMWRGCEPALAEYGIAICQEWTARGYRDTFYDQFTAYIEEPLQFPPWLGDPRLHSSHRAALLFKFPEHYSKFNWPEKARINYYWPL